MIFHIVTAVTIGYKSKTYLLCLSIKVNDVHCLNVLFLTSGKVTELELEKFKMVNFRYKKRERDIAQR